MSLTEQQLTIAQDIVAFIGWCIKHDKPFDWCLINVHHDIQGLLAQEPCFLPRTTGYAKILKDEG